MTKTLTHIIAELEQVLAKESSACAATQEAWWLLEKVTSLTKAELLARPNIELEHEQQALLKHYVDERVKHKKPLQYILGSVPFCYLDITVKAPILIPRPETEEWVEWLVRLLVNVKLEPLKILDLCTGSGCIALALAHEFPHAHVTGIDINTKAIDLAQHNKMHNNINNCTFIQSNLYNKLPVNETFDLIVSNPPYLSEEEWQTLEPTVTEWEDRNAFVAPEQGMSIYKAIIQNAHKYLKKESILGRLSLPQCVLELGTHHTGVGKALSQHHFTNITIHKDLQGKKRWISACV